MQISGIRYFLALFQELNFCAAARRCHIAQPSLTTAIKRLEREVEGELFYRRPVVAATPLAFALGPYFERVVSAVDSLHAEAQRQREIRCAVVSRFETEPAPGFADPEGGDAL